MTSIPQQSGENKDTSQSKPFKVAGCNGDHLKMLVCAHCGALVPVPMRCGDRACPDCRRRELDRLRKEYGDSLREKSNNMEKLALVTLTRRVKPGAPLEGKLKDTKKCFYRLRKRKKWRQIIDGGMYAFECDEVRRETWNTHLHVIVEVTGAVEQYKTKKEGREVRKANLIGAGGERLRGDELGAVWKEVTGDSYVVDIQPVLREKGGAVGALGYILKYLNKQPRLQSRAGHREYNAAVKGSRLVQTFGSWHGEVTADAAGHMECPDCGGCTWFPEFRLKLALSLFRDRKNPQRAFPA